MFWFTPFEKWWGSGLVDAEKMPSEACRSVLRPSQSPCAQGPAPRRPCLLHPPPHVPTAGALLISLLPDTMSRQSTITFQTGSRRGFSTSLSHSQPSHRPLSLQLRVRDPLLWGQWEDQKDQRPGSRSLYNLGEPSGSPSEGVAATSEVALVAGQAAGLGSAVDSASYGVELEWATGAAASPSVPWRHPRGHLSTRALTPQPAPNSQHPTK